MRASGAGRATDSSRVALAARAPQQARAFTFKVDAAKEYEVRSLVALPIRGNVYVLLREHQHMVFDPRLRYGGRCH